jgi:hypothetical protein
MSATSGAPLFGELRILEDGGDETRTVDRRIRVHRANELLHLAEHAVARVLILAHGAPHAGALAVEAKVLGERLAEHELVAVGDELVERDGVARRIAAGEALVGEIEHDVVALGLREAGDLLPLLWRGVDAGGIVRAGVVEEDGAGSRGVNVGEHALRVETAIGSIVVAIVLDSETGVSKDRNVIAPGRRRHKDRQRRTSAARALRKPRQKVACNAQRTRAADRLRTGDTLRRERLWRLRKRELKRGLAKRRYAVDARVFMISIVSNQTSFSLFQKKNN